MRVLTLADLESHVSANADAESLPAPALCTVEDVMVEEVISVRPDTSLQTVAELMLENGITGVPVVNGHGRLVGLVSQTDLVRRQVDETGEAPVSVLGDGLHLLDGTTAGEVMTRDVLTVREGTSLSEVAKVMVLCGVHRVPVVTRTGTLAGLVSTSDIVRWVAGLP